MPRHARLVLAQQTAGLRQRQSLRIVIEETKTVARVEPGQGIAECGMDEWEVASAVWIGRLLRRRRRLLIGQRLDSGSDTCAIDEPLRQHRPQPCRQTAPAMEIAE